MNCNKPISLYSNNPLIGLMSLQKGTHRKATWLEWKVSHPRKKITPHNSYCTTYWPRYIVSNQDNRWSSHMGGLNSRLGYQCCFWEKEYVTRSPGAWRSAWQDGRPHDHRKLDNIDLDVYYPLTPAVFEAQHFWKLEIHPMTPRITWSINFTSILYTLNTHPWGPNFNPFPSTTSHFQDTILSKTGNVPNDPRITLTT